MPDVLLVVDVQRALVDMLPPERRTAFVATLTALIERARARELPLVYVRHHDEELIRGTPSWEIVAEIAPQAGEPIVVCGMQTEHCIDSTARGGLRRGYAVAVVEDAHATYDWDGRSEAAIRSAVNAALRADGIAVIPAAQAV